MREILTRKMLIIVYKALIDGIIAWGGLYKNSLYPLKIVQNYILKSYAKNKRYTLHRNS